ncbi:hypothetical protein LZ30DRAFT_467195 [Colletotrichum cereale]|nr:hypothetical protein LZ30DRAFT_467195 [Colletotrichum cereale]
MDGRHWRRDATRAGHLLPSCLHILATQIFFLGERRYFLLLPATSGMRSPAINGYIWINSAGSSDICLFVQSSPLLSLPAMPKVIFVASQTRSTRQPPATSWCMSPVPVQKRHIRGNVEQRQGAQCHSFRRLLYGIDVSEVDSCKTRIGMASRVESELSLWWHGLLLSAMYHDLISDDAICETPLAKT